MDIVMRTLDEIKPYEKNPRKNDEAVPFVAESIKEFGFKVPIVVDKDGTIVTGHTRYKAARKLELNEVPVIVADDLTEEQIDAYRLADNKVAEKSEWDMDLLLEEIESICDIDMADFGFDDLFDNEDDEDDSNNANNVTVVEVATPELPKEPKSKLGDVYQLGNHRLMCGDSTNVTDIDVLMDGKKADLVFTDPPYGMKKENDGVANDNLNYDDLLEFNRQWIPLTFGALKDNGSWYCWGIDEPLMDIYSNILKPMQQNNQITFRNLITWDKGSGQGQMSELFRMYPIADEKCLFVMCGVQGFNNNSDNYFEGFEPIRKYFECEIKKLNESDTKIAQALGYKDGRTVNHWWNKSQWNYPTNENIDSLTQYGKSKGIDILLGNEKIKKEYEKIKKEYEKIKKEYEKIKKEYEEIKKEWYGTRAFFNNTHDNQNNVWHFNRTNGDEKSSACGHATPKPIALCSRAIKSSSRENEVVLDVFGGSGSTLIACEQLGRHCYAMELEPRWVDVIIERWEKFTGEKAVLINEYE